VEGFLYSISRCEADMGVTKGTQPGTLLQTLSSILSQSKFFWDWSFDFYQKFNAIGCFGKDSLRLIKANTMKETNGMSLPVVHVQTAGHVSGAAFYYQRHHVSVEPAEWQHKVSDNHYPGLFRSIISKDTARVCFCFSGSTVVVSTTTSDSCNYTPYPIDELTIWCHEIRWCMRLCNQLYPHLYTGNSFSRSSYQGVYHWDTCR